MRIPTTFQFMKMFMNVIDDTQTFDYLTVQHFLLVVTKMRNKLKRSKKMT